MARGWVGWFGWNWGCCWRWWFAKHRLTIAFDEMRSGSTSAKLSPRKRPNGLRAPIKRIRCVTLTRPTRFGPGWRRAGRQMLCAWSVRKLVPIADGEPPYGRRLGDFDEICRGVCVRVCASVSTIHAQLHARSLVWWRARFRDRRPHQAGRKPGAKGPLARNYGLVEGFVTHITCNTPFK